MKRYKNKLYVLLGEAASGKDFLFKEIVKHNILKPIISTTTRKARENEDSNTYNFVDNMTFNLMDAKDEFLEKTSYIIPSEGLVKYGTNKLDLQLDKYGQIAIVNPDGMKQLEKNLGKENIVSLYIYRDPADRIASYLKRDNRNFDKLFNDCVERYNRDKEDFRGIPEKVNHVLNNNGTLYDLFAQFTEIVNQESNNR